MQTLAIVGPDAADAAERLAPRLDGSVATVERRPDGAATDGAADAAFGLAEDGSWTAAGADRSLATLVDDLAPDYDYALLVGFPAARAPALALGDAVEGANEDGPDVLARADDAADVDYRDLAARLNETEPHVTLTSLVRRIRSSPGADRAGAIATFTGRVRAKDAAADPRTTHLQFEKYEGVAERRLGAIREELCERDGVHEVLMHHRTGVVADGEDIVFVVVLAGHREEAFRAVEDGIDRLKDEVPIFKKEVTVEDEFWVHDRK